MSSVEYVTTAKHWLGGGDLETRLRAELREKTQAGQTMHGPARSLSREEIAALNVGRQEKPAPAVALPPPPPVRACAHRPRRDPDGDWVCVGCGECVDAPEPERAPEHLAAPPVAPRRKPSKKPAPRTALPPETSIRLADLHELLDALRCEPMSVLPRHLAMAVGRSAESVLHDLGILREFGLAKQAASGRWRACA